MDVEGAPLAAHSRVAGSRLLACVAAFAATCTTTLPAQAEDIDVYTAQIEARKKANVLFVLDYSGSMREDIEHGDASKSGLPRKIDVLRDAMEQVLSDPNNSSRIRAGIGSIFDGNASGVRWPVADLDVDAHTIDPAIPEGKLQAYEAMLTQLDRRDARGATRTVNALVEAAMYFRGGPVSNGGSGDPRESSLFEPDEWDASLGRYAGGQSRAAIAASYTPTPSARVPNSAYWRDVYQAGDFGWCLDYSESGGTNGCAGKRTFDCDERDDGHWYSEGGSGGQGEHELCKYEHPDHWNGATYDSPIEGQCDVNAIVLISDGLPDRYHDSEPLREVLGADPSSCERLNDTIFQGKGDSVNGDCGPEIVRALAEKPQIEGVASSTVRTFTVGFGIDGVGQDYLDRLAREANGGEDGGSFSASNGDELVAAIKETFELAVGGSESFVELAVDVDKASFSHSDRAYFNLFTPSARRAWSGNLKGYFVDADGFEDVDRETAIVTGDDPDTPLVTESGTRFAKDARSFWSDTPDGDVVTAGGASEQLVTGGRDLYTFLGNEADIGTGGVPLALVDAHRIEVDNGAITPARLGTDGAGRDAALDWLQTAPMGDPLHSKSVSVDYGDRQVVYVMTNQGLLHAIDATDPTATGSGNGSGDTAGGGELFAFMPARLLSNLPVLRTNPTGGDHVYGLDGGTTRWHDDENNDGIVNGDDTITLVVGMRRGGEAYYALDVTRPLEPALKWVIDSSTPGFAELAQSWSRASLVRVQRDTRKERVLVFGGGYDPMLDGTNAPVASRGNAVFVVDRGGNLVRKFTHPAMMHALAADLTVIDSDADGLADRIYAADLGGQVWRIDFDDIEAVPDSRVTRLASLSDGTHQPFFSAPSVALNRDAGGDFLTVALGSGNRTEPLDEGSSNAFFVLRDTDVDKGAPATASAPVQAADLRDATSSAGGDAGASAGWLVRLAPGEKSLSRVVSFEGQLLATTFAPDTSVSDACSFRSIGRFYRMDLITADSRLGDTTDLSDEGTRRRWRLLDSGGIPSAPLVLFPKGSGTVQIIVDKERVDTIDQRLTRVYWHAK